MPAPPRVVFALLGDPTGSSRALRQLRALRALGLDVRLLAVGPMRRPDVLRGVVGGAVAAPWPAGRGPAFFWRADRAVRRLAGRTPAALYLASDLYVLPALAAAARRHGGRLVYDSRELYAALDSSAGRPHVAAAWQAVEGRFIGRADAVLTVGDQIADRLAEAYGIARPTVLYNAPAPPPPDGEGGADRARAGRDALRARLGLPDDGRVVVLYQGLLRAGRGLPALVEAARRVDGVRLVVIGEGELWDDLARLGAPLGDRFRLHPFVPPDALAALTPGADLGACLIEPLTESLRLSLPNKLFEYLAAGVPVIASPLPEIRRVVERGVGVLADPADPAAVAAALRRALDADARESWAGRTTEALAPYAWDRGRGVFQDLVLGLLR
ncbi:glycosyltransferase family 4 protein [Rubrivirga sp. S365]|uniref:glycosyltransferase family 4 protein n=1 Tax=Rubrivirga sp. S365 TaxID=3076080 RepID=UPI0028C7611A|nr:glycosyltransferase family 4 protein [Rubrivirga sp. S365]MDT7856222.1 glycosyltransferase family 4 protein [Rubrivirga sp. S365]